MAGVPVIGNDCKSYYNTATHATPTWVLIADARDVRVNLTRGEPELLTRASAWAKTGAGKKRGSIEIDYVHQGGTTVFTALQGYYFADTVTEFAFMDTAIATSDSQGFRAYCVTTGMSQPQELEGWVYITFTLKPAYKVESAAVVDPDWYDVT